MAYEQLPLSSVMDHHAFLAAMNQQIIDCNAYEFGMTVQTDGNGYWLELNGERIETPEAVGLLAQARSAVLAQEE